MKKVLVLGASGSIGESTLQVIRKHSDCFRLCGFSCHSNAGRLLQLAAEFNVAGAALSDDSLSPETVAAVEAEAKKQELPLFLGRQGLKALIEASDADIVVNGIDGSAGLEPSVWVLNARKDLALANKETLVMAGEWILQLADANGVRLLPVDSEHAAIFELLNGKNPAEIDSLWITASGGPFRTRPYDTFDTITVDEALHHPTWKMGKRITLNSATMANKGLEVIEAACLFHLPPRQIRVILQPGSRVHSLIKTVEGSFYAQISDPNMELPILNALSWPRKIPSDVGQLNFSHLTLQFEWPDLKKYPLLPLAFQAAEMGGTAPLIYNSANEAAVECFIRGRIPYLRMAAVVEEALRSADSAPLTSVSDMMLLNDATFQRILSQHGLGAL